MDACSPYDSIPALLFLALASVLRVSAQQTENLSVMPANDAQAALKAYLLKECRTCFDARRQIVGQIKTPEQIVERQRKLRADWLSAIGGLPERTPLNPRVVAVLRRQDYRIEKVVYESRPNHHVTANLYLPETGAPPFPGVLVPCGHSANGKADKGYQSMCILLVKHGFVALCYDPIGQGERCQILGDSSKPVVGSTTEHTLTDIGARLVGWGAATYRIWDGIRSIDYLTGRPEVDPKRIGCTGNSGGGTMTSYLMVTDDRIWAAAPSCYITSLERLFNTIGPQDGEQNITAQTALGIEHADYISMRAPKPTLVLTAARDFFDIAGSWESFREAKGIYSILGHGERVDLFEYPDTHGFSKPRREAALRWMRRWLQGIDDAPSEPALDLNSDSDLQVTACGQVLREFKGASVWDANMERARSLAVEREAFWRNNPKAKCLEEVRRLAGIRPQREKAGVKTVGVIERGAYRIEKLLIERNDAPSMPALLFAPRTVQGKLPAVVYVDGRGKAEDGAPGGPVEKMALNGQIVLSIDARGFGETAPAKPREYWHNEYPIAYLAIHLGRPLLGQRVEDVLAALDALAARPEADPAKITIAGIERGGPVALHAAALDERVGEVVIERSIESWMDVVATPLCKDQLNQIVPSALTRYDLPDLVKAIGPRPVHIRSAVSPDGEQKSKE